MGRLASFSIFLFLLSASSIGLAQQFTLRQYTAIDGLPQSQVNAIVEDQYGYLWIATSGGGLARFDGREFKVYSTLDGLLSNIVTSLFIDSRQNVWTVHPQGLTRFDGLNFKKFQPSISTGGLKRIRRMVELNDTIFVVSITGMIGKIHQDSVYYWSRQILPGKSIFFTHVSADRQICYYLNDRSFLVPSVDGYRRFSYATTFGVAYNIFNHGNEVWVDTDSGAFALDLKSGELSKRKKMMNRYIVCYDAAQDTYWTRDERTLFREHIQTDGLIQRDTVLRNVPITQILLDSEGNTWFGTAGSGLYRYYSRDFDRCGSDQLRAVMAIEKDRTGATWIGGSALWRILKGKTKMFPLPNGDDDGVRTIRMSPLGEIWVGSYSGLGRFSEAKDKFTWYTREDSLSSAYVTAIDFDEKGGVWIGTTGGGLNYYDGKHFAPFRDEQVLRTRNVSSIRFMPSTKSLFIGTEFGLNVLKDNKITSISLPEFENTTILSLAVYRDSLLVAGSGGAGVAIINPKRNTRKLMGPREGLPSGFVFFVATDESDRIWVGTEKGITRLRLDSHLEVTETRDYGHDNGLIGIETNQNAYFLSPQEKFFGLIDGLYQYNEPGDQPFRSYRAHLTDVEIQYGEVEARQFGAIESGFFKIPVKPVFPSDRNHITFQFNRVDKKYPRSVRYKYFLKNFDKTWSQPTADGRVTYSNLPPGQYVFNVVATDKIGSWDHLPLEYAFQIKAPFYRTAAFYLVIASLLLGSMVLFVLIRMRKNISRVIEVERIRQQEQESLRKEIARDFHDEMGNQLTRIINYVSLMRLNGNGHGPELYRKVEESAKYLYNGTRDFIWAIDPVNDDLSKLFIHVRDFGEKLFEEKGIHFRAYNEAKDNVKLPYGFSREANLIFKEAMTNAFKHSDAKNVSFYLRPTEKGYEMVLEDDGIGLEVERIKSSNGIKNIRSRAEKIQSSLVIDKPAGGQGTRVQLQFSTIKKKTYDTGNEKARPYR
jgi:ligand-binding sensor domain-containing protein/signal transduction histidine kinase